MIAVRALVAALLSTRFRLAQRAACFVLLAWSSGYSQIQYRIDTVAGQPFQSGLPVSLRSFHYPTGLSVDPSNNLYVAESIRVVVDKIANGTTITTIVAGFGAETGLVGSGPFAGSGLSGASGDGGPATSATFNLDWYAAQDHQGNLYIADNGTIAQSAASMP
jgi:hypothetical protein